MPERTDEEIEAVANEAMARAAEVSRWPGMTYEQGVRDALAWVLGEAVDDPFAEN